MAKTLTAVAKVQAQLPASERKLGEDKICMFRSSARSQVLEFRMVGRLESNAAFWAVTAPHRLASLLQRMLLFCVR
jgi:hypothetical protein